MGVNSVLALSKRRCSCWTLRIIENSTFVVEHRVSHTNRRNDRSIIRNNEFHFVFIALQLELEGILVVDINSLDVGLAGTKTRA